METLPAAFTHEPPTGYRYEIVRFKATVLAIWIVHINGFNYSDHDPVRCIWGFYNTKKESFFEPKNSKSVGAAVDFTDTTPYSSMTVKIPFTPTIANFL